MARSLLLALVGALLLMANAVAKEKEPKLPPAKTLEELDKRLTEAITKAQIPGASVTIIENNQIVLTKGYGVSDLKTKAPVTPETVFRAGSVSKSWTGLAIMMLVEEGKLSLDTKLADLMPELKFDNPWEATDPIRVAHLLEHTTGFNDIGFRHYLLTGKDIPLAEAVNLYGPYKSRWKPGTRTSYCNAGPVIAGRIIEKITGKRFQDFMAERLTGPLKMESAFWTLEPQIAGRISKSYKGDGVTPEPFMDVPARPSGSLNVTSKDLARLPLLMLGRGTLDGVTYFSPAAADRIEYPQTTNAVRAGLKYGYSLGNVAYPEEKAVFHGHDGAIDGFVAEYRYAPGKGAGLVVMINAQKNEVDKLVEAITDYLQRDWPAVPPADKPTPPAELAKWAGQYQTATPRQEVFALLTSLTQWQGLVVDGGVFSFNDVKRPYLGGGLYRKEDSFAPSLVFVDEPDGQMMYSYGGTQRRVPEWLLYTKLGVLGALAVAIVLTALFALIWIPSYFMGRLGERGGVTIRLLPFLSLASIIGLFATFIMLLGTDDVELLGRPSTGSWLLYGLTLAIPAFAALTFVRALVGGEASVFVRGLAYVNAVLTAIAAVYLYQYGWIGLKLWM